MASSFAMSLLNTSKSMGCAVVGGNRENRETD